MHSHARRMMGLEGASNRTPLAVERTAPVGPVVYGLTRVWSHRDGRRSASFPDRPWDPGEGEPSCADILTALGREGWRGQFAGVDRDQGGQEAPLAQLVESVSRAA